MTNSHAQRSTAAAPSDGWFWRWGAPLAASLGVLAAVGLAVASLRIVAAAPPPFWTVGRLQEMAVAAATFAAALLACWKVAGVQAWPSAQAVRNERTDPLVALAVVLAGVVLAALNLDIPLRGDESTNIINDATQPLSVAVSRYSTANNHVLHTLLVWVAHQIGGWNRVVLRMPAFLSFCIVLPMLWRFVRQEYGSTAALFATALVGASPFFIEYATNARGYTLMLLLFTSALLCGRRLVLSPDSRALWASWAVAIGLGCFAVPLMVFPAATTATWMLLARAHRFGRHQMRPFAARIVAWSAVALAIAGVLYVPVLVAEGVAGVQEAVAKASAWQTDLKLGRTQRALAHPILVWRTWHSGTPAWAQGALLALVVAGAAVPGRSCGRRSTLLLAMAVATGALLLVKPILMTPRMAIWALLVLMIMAGAGAAFVLGRALAWPASRWPTGTAPSSVLAARYGAVVLVFGAFAWWTTRPGVALRYGSIFQLAPSLPAMVSSVAQQFRPGDEFATYNARLAPEARIYMRTVNHLYEDAGRHAPLPNARSWTVHRVSAFPGRVSVSAGRVSASPRPAVAGSRPHAQQTDSGQSPGRLVLFDADNYESGPYTIEGMTARELLEEQWPDHELVAAFDQGRVYVVNEWRAALERAPVSTPRSP